MLLEARIHSHPEPSQHLPSTVLRPTIMKASDGNAFRTGQRLTLTYPASGIATPRIGLVELADSYRLRVDGEI